MNGKLLIRYLGAFLLLGAAQPSYPANILSLQSEPGDVIGLGSQTVVTDQEADFEVYGNLSSGAFIILNNFSRPNVPELLFYSLDFAPASGGTIAPGAYEGAVRLPFQGPTQPGLDVSGNGRVCNNVTGRFDVLEVEFDAVSRTITKFAADFEQHCEGAAPALFGSVRINSAVPVSNSTPPMIQVVNQRNTAGCVEATSARGAVVNLRASTTTPGNYEYRWSTSAGQTGTGVEFSPRIQVNETAAITLTVVSSGQMTSVASQVCVSDTTPPKVEILHPVNGQTISVLDRLLKVRISDTVDDNIKVFSTFVGYRAANRIFGGRALTVLPPTGAFFGADDIDTEVIVTARDASGNQGQAVVNVRTSKRSQR